MPRYHSWIKDIDQIEALLEGCPSETLDSQMIEMIFGVRRDAAIRTMRRLGAEKHGLVWLLSKRRAYLAFQQIRRDKRVLTELERRNRVIHELESTRRTLKARSIVIPMGAEEIWKIDGINPNTRLKPGTLEIDYVGAEDLLRQLMELAQAITNDYARFEAITEAP